MDKQELKPCPFCGGEAELVDTGYWSSVICKQCRTTSNAFVHSAKYCSADKATEAWNRRVDDGRED